MNELEQFLQSIGGFSPLRSVVPLRGHSNRNYGIAVDHGQYVVRLASACADRLGISREAEARVLNAAWTAGLGAEVLYCGLPEGHSVVRRLPAMEIGQHPDRYQEPDVLRAIVCVVKAIRALPAIAHTFDPFARIRQSFSDAAIYQLALPPGHDRVLKRLTEIEETRGPLGAADRVLCHNDLFAGNILDSDPIRVIDWEFAGMGDLFFDLATLMVACDESQPLAAAHADIILTEYFGNVTEAHRRRLEEMIFVVRLHVVAWGLTHHVLGTPARGWEGFSFLGFAAELLEQLISEL